MNRSIGLFVALVLLAPVASFAGAAAEERASATPGASATDGGPVSGIYIGVDRIDDAERELADRAVREYLSNYEYISIALVQDQQTIYSASYGRDRRGEVEVYASVAKPVTATITLMLAEQGVISDVDDSIFDYTDRFDNILPAQMANRVITFRHLLSHQSGLPNQAPLLRPRPWHFLFAPGTNTSYSTYGYGLLGAVLEDITDLSYEEMVQTMIGEPVGATSFRADSMLFDAPGGRVYSTIEDMARFAIGVSDFTYLSEDTLWNEVVPVQGYDGDEYIGTGWFVTQPADCDVAIYHAGSNGKPRAFLAIKPFVGRAVCIAGMNRTEDGADDFGALAIELMAILNSMAGEP